MLKYINYNRKSTESEDKQILSIISQEEVVQSMAEKNGLKIFKTISESKSAKTPGKRKGFKQMIGMIKSGQCNAIICWKLDRLARNMIEGGEIIELLQQGKILEIRTHSRIYTSNENVLVLAIEFGFANEYSRELSINVRRGQRTKAQMGYPHGIAPFGFLNKQNADLSKRHWVLDKDRFQIVSVLFEKVLESSGSFKSIYHWWTENYQPKTVKHKKLGNKPIPLSYFYKMLRNPIYAGYFYLEKEEYALHASLPRVITRSQYDEIQERLKYGKIVPQGKHVAHYTEILSGSDGGYMGPQTHFQVICDCKTKFAYLNKTNCPNCNVALVDMINPKYLVYTYYYNLDRKKKGERCKMVTDIKVEDEIREYISAFHFTPAVKKVLNDEVANCNKSQEDQELRQKIGIESVDSLELRKKRLRDLLIDEVVSKEEYAHDIAEIDRSILEIKINLAANKNNTPTGRLEDFLNLYDVFKDNTKMRKIKLMRSLGLNLIWDEKNLYFKGPNWLEAMKVSLIEYRKKNGLFEPKKQANPLEFTRGSRSFDKLISHLVQILCSGLYLDNK